MSKILKSNKTACTFQDHCLTYQLHRNPETRTGSPTARDCFQAMTRHTPHRCLLRLLGPSWGNVKSFPTGPQDLVTCVFSSVQLETGKPADRTLENRACLHGSENTKNAVRAHRQRNSGRLHTAFVRLSKGHRQHRRKVHPALQIYPFALEAGLSGPRAVQSLSVGSAFPLAPTYRPTLPT